MSDLAGWPEGGRNSKFHRFKRPKGLHPRGTPLSCSLFEFLLPPFSSLPALQLCCSLTSAGQSNAFHWNTAAKGQQNSPGLGGQLCLEKQDENAQSEMQTKAGTVAWEHWCGRKLWGLDSQLFEETRLKLFFRQASIMLPISLSQQLF